MVMAVGISVEFCVHIAHSFITTRGTRNRRVAFALVNVGASVFKGPLNDLLFYYFLFALNVE